MKGRAKKPSKSLLTRLLGGSKKKKGKSGKKGGKGGGQKAAAAKSGAPAEPKPKPQSPLQRSVAEIKQMKAVGEADPERLARLLANLLSKEREKNEADKERFDELVWDIIQRHEKGQNGGAETPPE